MMNRTYFNRYCIIFFLTMGFAEMDFAWADGPSQKMDEGSVRPMIDRAVPLIEDITGMKFKEGIGFRIVKRAVVRDVLAEELLPQCKNLLKGADDDFIARQVETIAHVMSQSTLGKYSLTKKEVMIVPDNIESQIKMLGVNEEAFQGYLFLVVAHEIVHALDDQWFDLQKKEISLDNAESMQAFAALLEGHAVYVTNIIAERLNLSETAKKISTKNAAGVMDEDARGEQQLLYGTYVKGAGFIEAIIKRKGLEGIAEAFASPPVTTRQILSPEEYFNPATVAAFDCARLLEGIADKLPIKGMQSQSVALGQINLSAILVSQGISEKDANDATGDCLDGAMISAVKQTLNNSMAAVMALYFKTGDAAERYFDLNEKIDRSVRDQYNATLNSSYTLVEDKTLALDGFESVVYRYAEIKEDRSVTRQISASGIMGSIFVSLAFIDIKEIGDEEIVDILRSMYARQAAMKREIMGH